jgi:signal transduction histidine kinase
LIEEEKNGGTMPQQLSTTTSESLAEALAAIPIFEGIDREQIEWFAQHAEDVRMADGTLLISAGEPAEWLVVILEGELHGRRNDDSQSPSLFIGRTGQVTGLLPFSRMTTFPSTVHAVGSTRIARLHKDLFRQMMERIPELKQRLLGVLFDRVREATKVEVEREKLSALGKLSAGLAHELNNPAAAVRQGVSSLRAALAHLEEASIELRKQQLTDAQFNSLIKFEKAMMAGLAQSEPADELERSDREAELEAWLSKKGVSRPWELAPELAEAGASRCLVDDAALCGAGPALAWCLRHAAARLEVERTLNDAERASTRISELVKAIKEYTYMDQGGEEEIDIHSGLENTLAMFHYRLKHGVSVQRDYDRTMPKICAYGSELNQVWTNLIDNALDAIDEKGELTVRTAREPLSALVEIIDNGPGIPPEVQPRIFEPFFTTKKIGQGTGLGLDVAYRIVRKHRGDIRFESQPGRTSFQVRLPFPANRQEATKP